MSKFLYYNILLKLFVASDKFKLRKDNNILELYINNTLMVILMPELTEQGTNLHLSYNNSMEYISIILDFLFSLVHKANFVEVILLLP